MKNLFFYQIAILGDVGVGKSALTLQCLESKSILLFHEL